MSHQSNKYGRIPVGSPHLNKNHDNNCACTHQVPPDHPGRIPASGAMRENTFYLLNSFPYVRDHTQMSYGQRIKVADSVFTRISRRVDPSSINLVGTFNLTATSHTNDVWNHFLTTIIKSRFYELNGLLPMLTHRILLRLRFTISDMSGGIVHEGNTTVTTTAGKFHSTDIKDYFLHSVKNMFVIDIPALDFNGPYTLHVDSVEAWGEIINTQNHVEDNLNPFYQWTNNNATIAMQHQEISQHPVDYNILLGECRCDFSTQFRGNITSRLRLAFTAFMSGLIMSNPNTFEVWKALFDSCGVGMMHMREDIILLQEKMGGVKNTLVDHSNQLEDHENRITALENAPIFTIESFVAIPVYNTTKTKIISIRFKWEYAHGVPLSQLIDGIEVPKSDRTFTMLDVNITKPQTFTLAASSGFANVKRTVTVNVLQEGIILFGSVRTNDPNELTNDDIMENDRIQSKELDASKFITKVDVFGDDDYFFFGTPMERPILGIREVVSGTSRMSMFKKIDNFMIQFPNGDVIPYQLFISSTAQNTLEEPFKFALRFPKQEIEEDEDDFPIDEPIDDSCCNLCAMCCNCPVPDPLPPDCICGLCADCCTCRGGG
jgi:hypothetical protein